MEVVDDNEYLFIRLEAGEGIIESLKNVARSRNIRVGAITSGVGMLSNVELGFFCVEKDDYDRHKLTGIYDLSSIQGNVTWNAGQPVPHVHMTFNDAKMTTYSGHIIEAGCHITMEIFVRRLDQLNLSRIKVPGAPATRITHHDIDDKTLGR